MVAAYSPVTVVSDSRRVDLALPHALSIADLLPQLVEICAPEPAGIEPARWVLRRADGRQLLPDHSLGEADVRDGEVLTLHAERSDVRPTHVEDVRDAVENAIDSGGQAWTGGTSLRFVLLFGAVGLAALALVPQARQAHDLTAMGSAVLAALVALTAASWATSRRYAVIAGLLVATGCVWGGVTGALAAGWQSAAPVTTGAAAIVGALFVAMVARSITPHATAHVAVLAGVAAATAGIALTAALGVDAMDAVRVEAVLVVLAIGALPRLSITVGGLAGADYQVRNAHALTQEQFAQRLRESTTLLVGGIVGTAVVGTGLGLFLASAPRGWDRLLSLAMAFGLLLRSRVFSQVWQVLPLRIAGVSVLVGCLVRVVAETPALRSGSVLLAALAFGVLALASAAPLPEVTRARIRYLLNMSELLVVAALVPIAAAALDMFNLASELTR